MNIAQASNWFKELQEEVCKHIEKLEGKQMTVPKSSSREGWNQQHKVMN